MRFHHIYTGDDGESHLGSVDVRLQEWTQHPSAHRSREVAAHVYVTAVGDGHRLEPHPASRRQLLVVLEGRYELECTNGERTVLEPGDVLFAEDLTGPGHATRELTGQGSALVVPFADDDGPARIFR